MRLYLLMIALVASAFFLISRPAIAQPASATTVANVSPSSSVAISDDVFDRPAQPSAPIMDTSDRSFSWYFIRSNRGLLKVQYQNEHRELGPRQMLNPTDLLEHPEDLRYVRTVPNILCLNNTSNVFSMTCTRPDGQRAHRMRFPCEGSYGTQTFDMNAVWHGMGCDPRSAREFWTFERRMATIIERPPLNPSDVVRYSTNQLTALAGHNPPTPQDLEQHNRRFVNRLDLHPMPGWEDVWKPYFVAQAEVVRRIAAVTPRPSAVPTPSALNRTARPATGATTPTPDATPPQGTPWRWEAARRWGQGSPWTIFSIVTSLGITLSVVQFTQTQKWKRRASKADAMATEWWNATGEAQRANVALRSEIERLKSELQERPTGSVPTGEVLKSEADWRKEIDRAVAKAREETTQRAESAATTATHTHTRTLAEANTRATLAEARAETLEVELQDARQRANMAPAVTTQQNAKSAEISRLSEEAHQAQATIDGLRKELADAIAQRDGIAKEKEAVLSNAAEEIANAHIARAGELSEAQNALAEAKNALTDLRKRYEKHLELQPSPRPTKPVGPPDAGTGERHPSQAEAEVELWAVSSEAPPAASRIVMDTTVVPRDQIPRPRHTVPAHVVDPDLAEAIRRRSEAERATTASDSVDPDEALAVLRDIDARETYARVSAAQLPASPPPPSFGNEEPEISITGGDDADDGVAVDREPTGDISGVALIARGAHSKGLQGNNGSSGVSTTLKPGAMTEPEAAEPPPSSKDGIPS